MAKITQALFLPPPKQLGSLYISAFTESNGLSLLQFCRLLRGLEGCEKLWTNPVISYLRRSTISSTPSRRPQGCACGLRFSDDRILPFITDPGEASAESLTHDWADPNPRFLSRTSRLPGRSDEFHQELKVRGRAPLLFLGQEFLCD